MDSTASYHKTIDSLRALADGAQQVRTRYIRGADRLRVIRDTVQVPLVTPAACLMYTEPRDQKLSLCQQETDSLRAALAADSLALVASRRADSLSRRRADTLTTLLKHAPRPCHVCLTVGAVLGSDGRVRPGLAIGFPVKLF
ncbi:MAG: hypothetical protein H0U85_03500 [Gemmatimonadales bacterium]|nr:hypothetical protein [Gemmatimonadales bacterium]